MSRPLPYGDPTRLGPFRLTARLDETAAGIVFLGVGDDGRTVSVAVLTKGAAEDAAARDRFRAAVVAALDRPGAGGPVGGSGAHGSVWAPAASRGAGGLAEGGDAAPVVGAQPDGPAPWVATAYEPGRPGAERFLEAVSFSGSFLGRQRGLRRGPHFQPYWAGSREPAMAGTSRTLAPGEAPTEVKPVPRSVAAAVLSLAALLGVLALLMLVLFSCRPAVEPLPPPPPTDEPSRRSGTSPSPVSPSPRTTSPSPERGESGTPGSGTPSGAPA